MSEPDRRLNDKRPVISCRVTPEDVRLVDAAAYRLKATRADLIYEAVMERVRAVLGITSG